MKNKYIPDRNDIIWIDFDPQAGKEIFKRRPALVLTSKTYNRFGLVILCPLTTQKKNYPFEIPIPDNDEQAVLADQIKSFDWRHRNAVFKGKAPASVGQQVIKKLGFLLAG